MAPPPENPDNAQKPAGVFPPAFVRVAVRSVREQVMGQSVVVIGAQWGDEGKGKIVDLLTENIG
ncbi:adenylosuccinate synthetase, partial [Acinetobacter baumannii]